MTDLDRYKDLLDKKERHRKRLDETAGAIKQLKRELKESFGVSSTAEAEKLLAEIESEEKKLEKKFSKLLDEFEKEFGERLQA